MPRWKIPVCWEMIGYVYKEAPTLEEAMEYARDEDGIIPIPTDSEYSEGSWDVYIDSIDEVRCFYNDGKCDEISAAQGEDGDIWVSDMSIESLLENELTM